MRERRGGITSEAAHLRNDWKTGKFLKRQIKICLSCIIYAIPYVYTITICFWCKKKQMQS